MSQSEPALNFDNLLGWQLRLPDSGSDCDGMWHTLKPSQIVAVYHLIMISNIGTDEEQAKTLEWHRPAMMEVPDAKPA